MKKVVLITLIIITFVLGFFIGGGYGWHLMDEFCGELVTSIAPSNDSFYLKKHLLAIDALNEENHEKAKEIIIKIAKFEAESISKCINNIDCKRHAGKLLISPSELERVKSLK
jgi:hypothetical protein